MQHAPPERDDVIILINLFPLGILNKILVYVRSYFEGGLLLRVKLVLSLGQ